MTWPGFEIVMTPPHVHMHVDELFSAGMLPISTIGDPGVHGDVVTGMHGWGVSTPRAADVAAATCGFDGVVHMPNGGMFTFGLKSMMLAAGADASTLLAGATTRELGATPKLQVIIAPATTSCPMPPTVRPPAVRLDASRTNRRGSRRCPTGQRPCSQGRMGR